MKGEARILEVRKAGFKPVAAFITDLPWFQESSSVHIESDDAIDTLDFRFLKGLFAHVSVFDDFRGNAIANLATQEADRVICTFYAPGRRAAVRMTDSQGNQQWNF